MDNHRTILNAKRPHFFEVFDPASSSDLLKIPSKFVKHMEGRSCGSVSLVGPSGNTWHVNLVHRNSDLLLHDGWAAFVRDHFIEGGDSLVFRYDGNLHFTVQIFDQSSCEKESAFSSVCSQDCTHFDEHMGNKRTRENTISCLDAIFEGVPKKIRGSQAHLESVTMAERCEAAVHSNELETCASLSRTVVTYAIPLQSTFSSENSDAIIHRVNKEDGPGSCAGGCMPLLPAPEAERVARSFTSSFPNFMSIMKRFNVSGSYTLNIPCQFSMDHLPNSKLKIVLHNLEGKSWTVNAVPTTRVQTSHTFCGGWVAFVRDNNIDTGDICIFELVRSCELRVQILRVVKEGLDSPSGRPAFKGLTNGNVATSHKKSENLRKKMSGNSRNAYLQWNSKVDISAIYSTTSLIDKKGSQTRGCVSMKSAPEEKRAAQAFVSVFPHFVRIMKKFNVSGSYTLKIPYRFSMEHLPNCRTEIILHNLRAECWTVNSVPTTKVQTLHTFCGGWMAFVRGNDIQMGDLCIFELIGKCEMRVHISGVGKKGLDYQSGNAAPNELTLGSFNRNHSR